MRNPSPPQNHLIEKKDRKPTNCRGEKPESGTPKARVISSWKKPKLLYRWNCLFLLQHYTLSGLQEMKRKVASTGQQRMLTFPFYTLRVLILFKLVAVVVVAALAKIREISLQINKLRDVVVVVVSLTHSRVHDWLIILYTLSNIKPHNPIKEINNRFLIAQLNHPQLTHSTAGKRK